MTTLTFLGHSTFLIESDGHSLLVDPFLTENPSATVNAGELNPDFILITHGHFDHVGHIAEVTDRCETDLVNIAKRTGATVICSFEIAVWLGSQGVETSHGMGAGGSFKFDFGRVRMTPAVHSAMLPDGANGGIAAGYVLHLNDATIYIAGDTALFSDMALLSEHDIDAAVLPIGDNFTMGPDEAVTAAEWVGAKQVIPCHYDTWPMLGQDTVAFAERLSAVGIATHALKPNEAISLPITSESSSQSG